MKQTLTVCENCACKDVCSLKGEFARMKEQISSIETTLDTNDFSLCIKCKHFIDNCYSKYKGV